MITEAIITLLIERRAKQDDKWGPVLTRDEIDWPLWLTILAEEFGEVARAILERDKASLANELIDVAAVAISMLEWLMPTVDKEPSWR